MSTTRTGGDGFAGIFEQAASGEGVLFILLLAAFGWGALHALSPGHGKAMVAAYLVGTRGKPRHAVALGATVTVAHTVGVFLLGFVTLALSQYVLPEDLYPWLNLVSGLLVVVIGAGVLRSRMRWTRGHSHQRHARPRCTITAIDHDAPQPHARGLRALHGPPARPGHHGHATPSQPRPSHAGDHTVTKRSLIGLGAAAGLIPCPSALVVLLGAIAQHEIALGLLLIVAFSLGLAGTLTGLGLAVVYARKLLAAPQLGCPLAAGTAAPRRPAESACGAVIGGLGPWSSSASACPLTVNARRPARNVSYLLIASDPIASSLRVDG